MPSSNKIIAVPLISFDSASLTASYQSLGPTPNSLSFIRFVNDSDTDVSISYDGSTNNDIVLAGTEYQLNLSSFLGDNGRGAQFPKGKQVYAKGTAGTGLFYVVGYTQQ